MTEERFFGRGVIRNTIVPRHFGALAQVSVSPDRSWWAYLMAVLIN